MKDINIKIKDIDTKDIVEFKSIKEFIDFLKPLGKSSGLEFIYEE